MRGLCSSLALVLVFFGFICSAKIANAQSAAALSEIKFIQPKEVAAGATDDLRIRIKGKKKFKKDAIVVVNGTDVTTQLDAGQLLGFVPAALLAQPGTINISVRNATQSTGTASLSVVAQGNLEISAIRPRVVVSSQVSTSFGIEIQGSNFNSKAVVRVGGFKTTTEVRRKGDISFVVGTVDLREVQFNGSVPIQVENGDGSISNTFTLFIVPPGPNLNALDPGAIDIGTGDTKLTLTGTNFTSSSQVFVNNQLVPSKQKTNKKGKMPSTTILEAMVPAAMFTQVGQLVVKVINPGVGDSDTLLLDVTPTAKTPQIFSIDPVSIVAGSKDTEIVILGGNLQNLQNITINGKKAAKEDVTEINKRASSVILRAKNFNSPTVLNIVVTTKGGTSNSFALPVEASPTVNTFAGDKPGFVDGTGTSALFTNPGQAILGPDGLIYIADQTNHAIRRMNPATAQVVTIAGNPDGRPGYVDTSDLSNQNTSIRFSNPISLAFDSRGQLFVSDFGNDVIRRIKFDQSGSVTSVDTVAGRNRIATNDDNSKEHVGLFGFFDDQAQLARFSNPYGITFDNDGNLLVADSGNNVIRKVLFQNGEATQVITAMGNGFPGISDGIGKNVQFKTPIGLTLKNGTLFVSDFGNNSIRAVDMSTSQVRVFAGLRRSIQSDVLNQVAKNTSSFGDGTRFFAVLSGPISSAVDDAGNLFFIDFNRNRVRRISPNGSVTTIVGGIEAGFVDGLGIPKAEFRDARHLFFVGPTLFMVDSGNHRIRTISLPSN